MDHLISLTILWENKSLRIVRFQEKLPLKNMSNQVRTNSGKRESRRRRWDETRHGWYPWIFFSDKDIGIDMDIIASTFENEVFGCADIFLDLRSILGVGRVVKKDGIFEID